MSLRVRTTLIVTVALAAVITTLNIFLMHLLTDDFARIENARVVQDVERARDALYERIHDLRQKTSDWAAWNDTYHFVKTRDSGYINSNFTYQSFSALDIEFALYFDRDGTLIFQRSYDFSKGKEVIVDPKLLKVFLERPVLTQHPDAKSIKEGFLMLPSGPLLFVSLPIITSAHRGPVRGSLIFAKYLSQKRLDALGKVTHLSTKVISLQDPESTTLPDLGQVLAGGEANRRIVVAPIDAQWMRGYTVLNDFFGNPVFAIETLSGREVHQQALRTMRTLNIALVAAGLVLGVLTILLIQRWVVSRIVELIRDVLHIKKSGNPSGRVHERSYDELGVLAHAINDMLGSFERVQLALQKSESRARELAEKAQRASVAKSKFVALLSHDIRTPLNGILGIARLLRCTKLTTEQCDHLDLVINSSESLLTVINSVSDFSLIEAGKLSLHSRVFNIEHLVHEVVGLFQPEAKRRELVLSLEYPDGLPSDVIGDSAKVRQVLLNLVGNALTYTDTGSVTVRVYHSRQEEHVLDLRFEVCDTGRGIPVEKQQAIFEAFEQGSLTHEGGTGLGLTIAKSYIEAMGGRIGLESSVGKGSTFWFELTLRKDKGSHRAQTAYPAPQSLPNGHSPAPQKIATNGHPIRVLVVEDNRTNQILTTALLQRLGLECELVASGQEALTRLTDSAFNLVLMDCQMPGMDGYETSRAIRSLPVPYAQTIPIVALTAFAMAGDKEKCLENGMNDYVSKPIQPEMLRTVIARWTVG
jgi:signal transduction histidine kinase/ActR/RegA family two-component response regulator